MILRICEVKCAGDKVIDIDGMYLWQKHQTMSESGINVVPVGIPSSPLTGWESVTEANHKEYANKIPQVTAGTLYAYNIRLYHCYFYYRCVQYLWGISHSQKGIHSLVTMKIEPHGSQPASSNVLSCEDTMAYHGTFHEARVVRSVHPPVQGWGFGQYSSCHLQMYCRVSAFSNR